MKYEDFAPIALAVLSRHKELSSTALRKEIGRAALPKLGRWQLLSLFARAIEEKCGRHLALQPVTFDMYIQTMVMIDGTVIDRLEKPKKGQKPVCFYSLNAEPLPLTGMSTSSSAPIYSRKGPAVIHLIG